VRTGLEQILELVTLVLEVPVVQHVLHFLVEPAHQNLEILAQSNFFLLNDIKHGLSEVVSILHVLVEGWVGECLLYGLDTVEVENDEVGTWLIGLLDIVDGHYLTVA
jgi:hypothetical protein